jgi:hypothetical protein
MRRATILLLLLVTTVCGTAFAQSQSSSRPAQKPNADRLGMTCAQILKMTSAEWIVYLREKLQSPAPDAAVGLARAIAVYGKCYDERTDRLAATLARSGKGPLMGARGDFRDFEAALKDFAVKALADAQPPADSQKIAYVNLYEKQFRYDFYQEYEAKTVRPAKPAAPAAKAPPPPAAAPPAGTAPVARAAQPTPATAEDQARSNADPVTMAKNRFGKLLEVLPDDKMHELHRAFGDVIGPHSISEPMRLAVYRYAIFILEPPSAKPFAPPPF